MAGAKQGKQRQARLALYLSLFVSAFSFTAPEAIAGEQLSLEELVKRSGAFARIRVDLSGKQSHGVLLKWQALKKNVSLAKFKSGERLPSAWLGLCAPDNDLLKRWLRGHPRFPSRAIWKRALARGRYEVVIFVRPVEASQTSTKALSPVELEPTCEAEAMLGQGWRDHPEFEQWRQRLAELAALDP